MAFSIDTKAFGAFAQYGDLAADTRVQKGTDGFTTKATAEGLLGRLFRGASEKEANNAARTDFLRSLGTALNLDGMGTDSAGRTTFSKDFMDRLESLLGPNFKRADWGLDSEGRVKSGRPLTARRISAIITTATTGCAGTEFSIKDYRAKFAAIMDDVANRKITVGSNLQRSLKTVETALNVLENELPHMFEENIYFNENISEDDEDAETNHRWNLHCTQGGEATTVPVTSKSMVFQYLNNERDLIMHGENVCRPGPDKTLNVNDADFDTYVKAYIRTVLENYVKTTIDLCLMTKGTDLFEKFQSAATGICMEAQTSNVQEFQMRHGLTTEHVKKTGAAGKAEETAPVTAVADHGEKDTLVECICREIGVLENDPANQGKALTWKDYLPALTRNLVGLNRLQDDGTGQMALREVKVEDIANLKAQVEEALGYDLD